MEPAARTAAFFDIDGTLMRGATSWYLTWDLYRRGYFGWRDLWFAFRHAVLYLVLGEDPARVQLVKDRALGVMKGKLESDLALVGEELYDRVLSERIFPGTHRLIERHLAAGHEVWLVSATPDVLSRQIAWRLGVTGGLGTMVDVDKKGMLTGSMPGKMLHGPEKARAVRRLATEQGLDLKNCYAYSDSLSDLALLNLVGHARVVNPEPVLRRVAIKRGWPRYNFTRPKSEILWTISQSDLAAQQASGIWAAWALTERLVHILNRYLKNTSRRSPRL